MAGWFLSIRNRVDKNQPEIYGSDKEKARMESVNLIEELRGL